MKKPVLQRENNDDESLASLFTCCTYHCVEFWFFLWLLGLQGPQRSRGASLLTPLTLADAGGDAGLSPSSPNTGHSIHV